MFDSGVNMTSFQVKLGDKILGLEGLSNHVNLYGKTFQGYGEKIGKEPPKYNSQLITFWHFS